MKTALLFAFFAIVALVPATAAARKWTDATGQYIFEGDLIGVNDAMLVVQKTDKKRNLVAIPIKQLSTADQEFVKSRDAADEAQRAANRQQTWTMRGGLKVVARVVDYGRRDVTLQRRRGKIYVNDRLFENLTGVQQNIVMKIVAHFERIPIDKKQDLEKWIVKLKAEPKSFTCDGVLLELENGDHYGVPFFLFSERDLKILQPGWQQWFASYQSRENEAQAQAEQDQETLLLQSQAQAYQRDQETDRQLKVLELELLAVASGATDLWEVELVPRAGGYSRAVVVSGRDSEAAARAALAKFPNHKVGAIAKVSNSR